MLIEVISRSYRIEVEKPEFMHILKLDSWNSDHGYPQLYDKMENAGAKNIEYNGHFGTNIYFDLPIDLEDQLANIILVINSYMHMNLSKEYYSENK